MFAGKLLKVITDNTNRWQSNRIFDYKTDGALNVDHNPFAPSGTCGRGGLYFAKVEDIGLYLDYGKFMCEVTLPVDAVVYKEIFKMKADKIILGPKIEITPEVIVELIKSGMNMMCVFSMKGDLHDKCVQEFLKDKEYYRTIFDEQLKSMFTHVRPHFSQLSLMLEYVKNGLLTLTDELRDMFFRTFSVKDCVDAGIDVLYDDSILFTTYVMNGSLSEAVELAKMGANVRNRDDLAWKHFLAEYVEYTKKNPGSCILKAGFRDLEAIFAEHGLTLPRTEPAATPVRASEPVRPVQIQYFPSVVWTQPPPVPVFYYGYYPGVFY